MTDELQALHDEVARLSAKLAALESKHRDRGDGDHDPISRRHLLT